MKKEKIYYILIIFALAVLCLDIAFGIFLAVYSAQIHNGAAYFSSDNTFFLIVLIFNAVLAAGSAAYLIFRSIHRR